MAAVVDPGGAVQALAAGQAPVGHPDTDPGTDVSLVREGRQEAVPVGSQPAEGVKRGQDEFAGAG
ncbi:hypothetical protein MO973_09565 [Paenibacillus sp. TRM 82003]|nr:hypothetical protein [Paenibacillus sp. TRM 82003]